MLDLFAGLFGSERIPIASLATAFCAARRGLPASVMHEDPARSFELQDATRRSFGFDSHPFYPYATYGTWEHGTKRGHPSSELRAEPTLPHYPVRGERDLEELQSPDVARAGMLPAAMRFSELQRARGAPVSVVLGGVVTLAANLCGMESLFRWMMTEPELAHGLLRASRDHLLAVVKHWVVCFGAERVTPIVWEGMANATLISPRLFEEFVIPHQRRLHQQILELGVNGLIGHLCGDQSRFLSLWAEVPMGPKGVVSLGSEVDLRRASEILGDVALMGNVDPELLRVASPERVGAATRDCLAAGRQHPAGFILAPGCDLQCELPEANLRAMIRTAAKAAG